MKYVGQPAIIVNVASFSSVAGRDYSQLAALHQRYQHRGLRILAFPCNKPFAEAGPGTNSEIKDVASNFERFAKIDVNGEGRHPVFRALLAKLHPLCCRIKGEHSCCKVKGNFNEFLVDGRGVLVKHYPKRTPPAGAEQDIIALLADSESTTALTP